MDALHQVPLRAQENCGKAGRKSMSRREWRTARKQGLLDTAGLAHTWTHWDCGDKHSACMGVHYKGSPRAEKSEHTSLSWTRKLTPVDNHFPVQISLLQVSLIGETKHSMFTGPLCICYGFQFEDLMGFLPMQTVCLCLRTFPMPFLRLSLFAWLVVWSHSNLFLSIYFIFITIP